MYDKVKGILDILWRQDDMVNPDDLEKAQELTADLLLEVAEKEGKEAQLLKEYAWLYQVENA